LGSIPNSGLPVTIDSPSQSPFVLPGRAQGRFLAIAEQVTSFVQEHRGTFAIIDRHFKKFGVQRHDLKWKIGGGISIPVADIVVPPIICSAKHREMFQNKSLPPKTVLL